MKTPSLLLVIASLCIGSNAWAQTSRYVLDVRAIKGDDSNKVVALKDKKLNQIVWTRKLYNPQITWSKDRRAVAVEGVWHVLVWREGHPLRDFGLPSPSYGSEDYLMGCVWSPDKRRLLVRSGSSGSGMVGDNGAGALFSLRMGSQNNFHFTYIASDVTNMSWRDSRTVLYEALDYSAKTKVTWRKHVWRAP